MKTTTLQKINKLLNNYTFYLNKMVYDLTWLCYKPKDFKIKKITTTSHWANWKLHSFYAVYDTPTQKNVKHWLIYSEERNKGLYSILDFLTELKNSKTHYLY